MRTFASFFIAGFLIATSFGQGLEVPGLLKYSPPSGFKRDDARAPKGRIAFFAPQAENYSPNVMIRVIDAGSYTAKSLVRESIASMSKDKGIKVLSDMPIKVGGKECHTLQLELSLDNGMVVAQRQVIAVHKKKVILFIMSTLKKNVNDTTKKFGSSMKSVVWQ
jgi:hypothetical protein